MKTNFGSWTLAILTSTLALNNLQARIVSFETAFVRVAVESTNGCFTIQDTQGGVTWRSNPFRARFGEITCRESGQPKRVNLDQCEVEQSPRGLDLTFRPLSERPEARLVVSIRPGAEARTLEVSYNAVGGLELESVRLLDEAFWVTDQEQGYVVVPVREGLLVPADSGVSFVQRFDTFAYEGCHMQMLGVVKSGAAALLTWRDPYIAAELHGVLTNSTSLAAKQVLSSSLVLTRSARSFQIQFLGKGDYVSIAKAYRQEAAAKGWLVRWEEKLQGHPERARLFGAINYKLWSVLDRRMNEASTSEERVSLNWTFDEAAQVAEHLKNDLQLSNVLFTVGGWIHRGYDNQHPDILPSAPECGGDPAFTECARRVQQLGYLFCLHDNYQDIYRDSPSWDERYIMKARDGSLSRGGHWAGGLAFLTCSKEALELAKRPQNLPAVKELCHPNAYFIDTTYAAGLQECHDPAHPLTRADDIHWKQAISDYARDLFGIFGSECGREWAIPHSDFFEGLSGVSGRAYHDKDLLGKVGGVVIPLFEMVYRDCIAIYGKYGYDPAQAAEYVLQHIAVGRPLHYHQIPPHLYWKNSRQASEEPTPLAVSGEVKPDPGIFVRGRGGWADGLHPLDRFVKNTAEILSPLHELTATNPVTDHAFLTADRQVQRTVFGTGSNAMRVVINLGKSSFRIRSAAPGGDVVLPPYGFWIDGPQFLAFQALEFAGKKYSVPTMFTARSLDGKPIANSGRIRVYHGFGDPAFPWNSKVHQVEREAEITANP